MKIKTIENLAVIQLDVTVNDFKKVAKYAPDVMTTKDDEGNETFRVSLHDKSYCCTLGEIGTYGATFVGSNNKCLIWIPIPCGNVESNDAKKEYLMDTYGMEIGRIADIDKQIIDAAEDVAAKIARIDDCIENL